VRLAAAAILVAAMTASAAPATSPWAEGVSAEVQHRANVVFAAANDLFAKRDFAAAVKKYRESLELWDHPLVRFNLAVTLIRMDRVLEAADELDRSLQYGAEPFTPDLYQQALDYQKLVQGRVGELEVTCDQPHTHVLLDGKPWFDCPGTQKRRVLAGEHAVVGERGGFVPSAKRVLVAGGATTTETITLVGIERAITVRYPYPRWIGWTALGAGAAIAITGGAFRYLGGRNMERYETAFGVACPDGCDLAAHPDLIDKHDHARFQGTLGIVLLATGGAIAVGGIIAAVLDRPRSTVPNLELAPAQGGASVRWSF